MVSRKIEAFGLVTCILLGIADFLQIFWLIWLTIEQFKTGFGYGTNMEILALVPMLMNALALPVAVLGVIYCAVGARGRARRAVYFTAISLLSTLLLQVGLIQLFIWY